MEVSQASSMQIRRIGIKALTEALGPVGTIRFLQQFNTGNGDYTKERDELLENVSFEEAIAQIEKQRLE